MDTIEIEILDDGRVRLTTGAFGAANHRNADQLMTLLQKELGKVERKERNKAKHAKQHERDVEHQH